MLRPRAELEYTGFLEGISVIAAHLALNQNEVVRSHHPLPDRLAGLEKRERDESDALQRVGQHLNVKVNEDNKD